MKFTKVRKALAASEGLKELLFVGLGMAVLIGAVVGWMAVRRSNAKLEAQGLVGEHTIVNGKWFIFAGYSELYTADGKTIEVPTNTAYGSKFADYFLGKPAPEGNFKVRLAYTEEPQNIWPDSSVTKDYMAGAYLQITEVDERDKPIANEPVASNQ